MTRTPMLNVPVTVGRPLIVPFEFNFRPVGNAVVADQVLGARPPLELKLAA